MNENNASIEKKSKPRPSKRFFCGLIVFLVSLLMPLLVPVIIHLKIAASLKIIISGAMLFGIPEVGMVAAAIILGNEGFAYLKEQLLFWVNETVIPKNVSRLRYQLGIVLFSATLIIGFFTPYMAYFSMMSKPRNPSQYFFTLDFIFFLSLLILGGNFWEKLKALFVYEMIAVYPQK